MRKALVSTALFALLLVAILVAWPAPTALAVDVSTRIVGLGWELSTPLAVAVPNELTVTDSNGVIIACTTANPLGALYLTTQQRGHALAVSHDGSSIESIDGIGGPANTAGWWRYAVNGCMPAVGMQNWTLTGNETLLYFEVGETSLPLRTIKELVVEGPTTTVAGTAPAFTVRGDDLTKANSQEDAVKLALDPVDDVETAAAFAPVAGATLHVGNRAYQASADGTVAITDLPAGAYRVWAEKAPGTESRYVSSSAVRWLVAEFGDVPAGSPHYLAVHRIAALGVVSGYPSGTGAHFQPAASLYRAQLVKMIALAVGLDVVPGASSPFWDLGEREAGNPYPHDYVASAFKAGIAKGTGPTSFGPYREISRAQAVTMVTRAAMVRGLIADPPATFVGAWGNFDSAHGTYARLAEYNELLEGLDLRGAAADPWANMSRAEAAQVIANYLDLNDSLAE